MFDDDGELLAIDDPRCDDVADDPRVDDLRRLLRLPLHVSVLRLRHLPTGLPMVTGAQRSVFHDVLRDDGEPVERSGLEKLAGLRLLDTGEEEQMGESVALRLGGLSGLLRLPVDQDSHDFLSVSRTVRLTENRLARCMSRHLPQRCDIRHTSYPQE